MSSFKNGSEASVRGFGSGSALPKNFALAFIGGILLFQSCGTSKEEMEYLEKSKAMADSIAVVTPGLTTDTINGITRNFIRTADMKFKVKDVLRASQQIEDLVKEQGGYVSLNNMNSGVESQFTVQVSPDSLKEVKRYTTVSQLTLRVPNKRLDAVLRNIAGMAVFIDFSRLQSDDVKMKLYAGKLAANRYQHYRQRLEQRIDKSGASLKQSTAAEEEVLEKQSLADTQQLESYDLADQVNYSTVELHIYQATATLHETTACPPEMEPYRPSFASRLGESFLYGFEVIKSFLLFLARSWGLILIFLTLFVIVRKSLIIFGRKNTATQKSA